MYIKIILFCLLTSCVSINTHKKALEKINILELENSACTADTVEFQILMMKLNEAIYFFQSGNKVSGVPTKLIESFPEFTKNKTLLV